MLSVIVPARNDGVMTGTCLGALLHTLDRLALTCEIILIDDASAPSEGILPAFFEARASAPRHQFRIVHSRAHQHYSGVFSIGLHLSKGDAVFFLSNDMLVTPFFLSSLLAVSALDTKFGIVRGTSNHTDSHPEYQIVPAEKPKDYEGIQAFSARMAAENGLGWRADSVLSGDAVLLKRALIERIGVLDLRFFGYFGDVDYGMRAHLAGFELVCATGAWLYHVGGWHVTRESQQRGETDLKPGFDRRMALVSAAYKEFREKWGGDLPQDFADCPSLNFFPLAEAAQSRVTLRYTLAEATLDDLEFH